MADETGFKRSNCPIAVTLDVLGDRWTLLIARDLLFFGKRRFGDFADGPEAIPSNILTDRLKRMTSEGLVERVRYQSRPPRHEYLPTEKLRDLKPVLIEIVRWGNRHYPGTLRPGGEG